MSSIAQEIYKAADKCAGSTVTRRGDDVASAIDALVDALAGSDKPEAGSVAEAIKALTDYLPSGATLGTKTITVNDTYAASEDDLDGFSSVTVNVPNPSTGTLSITENGDGINVTDYAAVDVAVPGPSFGTPSQVISNNSIPTVGMGTSGTDTVVEALLYNNMPIAYSDLEPLGVWVASGVEVATVVCSTDEVTLCEAYVCTFADDKFDTVTFWGHNYGDNPLITAHENDGDIYFTFTMPALQEGETLVLWLGLD